MEHASRARTCGQDLQAARQRGRQVSGVSEGLSSFVRHARLGRGGPRAARARFGDHPATAHHRVRAADAGQPARRHHRRARRQPVVHAGGRHPRHRACDDERCVRRVRRRPSRRDATTSSPGPGGAPLVHRAGVTADGVARLDPTNGTVVEHLLPPGTDPTAIATGSDGNLWFIERGGEQDRPHDAERPERRVQRRAVRGRHAQRHRRGPDGQLWVTGDEPHRELRPLDPTTRQLLPRPHRRAQPDRRRLRREALLHRVRQPGCDRPRQDRRQHQGVPGRADRRFRPAGITEGGDRALWFTAGSARAASASDVASTNSPSPPVRDRPRPPRTRRRPASPAGPTATSGSPRTRTPGRSAASAGPVAELVLRGDAHPARHRSPRRAQSHRHSQLAGHDLSRRVRPGRELRLRYGGDVRRHRRRPDHRAGRAAARAGFPLPRARRCHQRLRRGRVRGPPAVDRRGRSHQRLRSRARGRAHRTPTPTPTPRRRRGPGPPRRPNRSSPPPPSRPHPSSARPSSSARSAARSASRRRAPRFRDLAAGTHLPVGLEGRHPPRPGRPPERPRQQGPDAERHVLGRRLPGPPDPPQPRHHRPAPARRPLRPAAAAA